jgi:F-type H+-transporting ATPase subunit beta
VVERRVQRFCRNIPRGEPLPIEGRVGDIKENKGFNAIMDGQYDHLPEMAFNLVGNEQAVGERILRAKDKHI